MPSSDAALTSGVNGDIDEDFRCLCCGHNESLPYVLHCRDYYLQKSQIVSYYACKSCGLVQQKPLPVDVASYYNDYPVHSPKSAAYSWFRRRLMASVYLPPQSLGREKKILDFGCGDGWYLEWCFERGLNAVGFEPSALHAQIVSKRIGVPVFSDVDRLIEEHAFSFDFVTLHFVVEHLTGLHPVFQRIAKLLKPGGKCRFVVPNISSWEFALFGRRWHSLDAPRHISFPTLNHARRLAFDSGLIFRGEESVAFPNGFGGSIPTALWSRFSVPAFLATLPLSIPVTRLFPSGNKAFTMSRPLEGENKK